MYILATLAATLTLYLAVRWLDEERERSRALWPVLYTLAASACLYTIYIAALAPLTANLYALVAWLRLPHARRRGVVARWLAAQVAALALFAPWALFAVGRMHTWSVATPFDFRLFLNLYATLLTLGISTHVERYTLYLLPFALVLLGGLSTLGWQARRPEPGLPTAQAMALLAPSLALLPLAVYILTRPRSLFYTPRVEARYLLLFAPAFYAFLAWSVARLARRARLLGGAALAVSLGLMLAFLPGYYDGRYLRDEMQTMARMLGALSRPGDVVLLISGDRYQLFGYYYERIVPPERRVPVIELPQGETFTPENVGPQLSAATAGRSRFWVAAIETSIQDPNRLSLPWLDQHFPRALTHDVGANALILYGREPDPLRVEPGVVRPEWPLQAGGQGVELFGYDLAGREYQAGDTVDLGLYYLAESPGRAEVQWFRADGQLLQSVTQEWPATAPTAARATLRFRVWPWYPGSPTRFVVRWTPQAGGPASSVELPGPRILALPNRPTPERIAQPLEVAFAQGIRLRGFDLHRATRSGLAQARPGEPLTLDLFWEAELPISEDYTVFTHLVGATHNPRTGGPVWAQHDGPPVDGTYLTSTWVPGQVIADRHVLPIDPAAPPGEYELEVGLYRPGTGERLRSASGEDHVILARVRVSR